MKIHIASDDRNIERPTRRKLQSKSQNDAKTGPQEQASIAQRVPVVVAAG